MSTVIRPEISEKRQYWISRHRYYELKPFCLQYPEWRKEYQNFVAIHGRMLSEVRDRRIVFNDQIAEQGLKMADLSQRMNAVKKAAQMSDSVIGIYIFKAVTEGYSFEYLKTVLEMPCEKDMYYDRYRKFFWLLSQER
jgi:hypothetical protein